MRTAPGRYELDNNGIG